MEHFEKPKQLRGAMMCLDDCAAIFQDSVRTTTLSPAVEPAVEDLSLTQNLTDRPNPSTNGKHAGSRAHSFAIRFFS